ncbi:hypothetical protein J2S55_008368 [Streptosporangium brasiliense]|uniref:Probable transposase IS891/IS1136/IS1341 domain-containing protein n=1 Tax=Streptosporangium brasiliense TaxID=47480 RepID=A0ABT9RII3_9ACTN|nr:transposase [Streptosporangium brasiliense]MDP9869102.1 hypothetical protein [Streptosporangium brasiliense]
MLWLVGSVVWWFDAGVTPTQLARIRQRLETFATEAFTPLARTDQRAKGITYRLAAAQRALARKKPGSTRRRKAVARLAALHATVRRQRLDGAHKAALALVRAYEVIVHEDLQVASMTRRAAPRPDGAGGYLLNGGSAKSGLNRSIVDAGWGCSCGFSRTRLKAPVAN